MKGFFFFFVNALLPLCSHCFASVSLLATDFCLAEAPLDIVFWKFKEHTLLSILYAHTHTGNEPCEGGGEGAAVWPHIMATVVLIVDSLAAVKKRSVCVSRCSLMFMCVIVAEQKGACWSTQQCLSSSIGPYKHQGLQAQLKQASCNY